MALQRRSAAVVALVAGVLTLHAASLPGERRYAGLTGDVRLYTIEAGDTLARLAARSGVAAATLAADNGLPSGAALVPGQVLRVDNRHVMPTWIEPGTIVVNVPQRMLFHHSLQGDVEAFPVAVGQRTWPTPVRPFTVALVERNPTWDVPASIRAEALRQGRVLPERVPPGPANPLGAYWIGLSLPGIGIHGTNAPASIYTATTHGCVRMGAGDIERLFSQVRVGTRGVIVYEPVLLAVRNTAVYLEVHPDVYRRAPLRPRDTARALAASAALTAVIDWDAADGVADARHGVARDVTRRH